MTSAMNHDLREQRLSAIGEMTAEFAHQVRTPLASAMLYVEQLESSSPEQQRVARKISERLHDLGRMVNDMLGFAAGARPATEPVDVHGLLKDVLISVDVQLDSRTRIRIITADASLRLDANKDALKGALLNLVLNAEQACSAPAQILLGACEIDRTIHLTVADNGPGIAREVLPRLFEPFFTTRPQGTGLGLAVVEAVASAHNGDVLVASTDAGTTFTIQIPRSSDNRGDHDLG